MAGHFVSNAFGNALNNLTNRYNELTRLVQRLNNIGGSPEYIQRLNNELLQARDVMQEMADLLAAHPVRSSVNNQDYARMEEALSRVSATYQNFGNTVATVNDRIAAKEISMRRSIDKTVQGWTKYRVANEQLINTDQNLIRGFEEVRAAMLNANTPEQINNASLMWERYKKSVEDAKRAEHDRAIAAERTLESERQMMMASIQVVNQYATTIKMKIIDGLWNGALSLIKNVIDATKTLDAELVEIRKVTDFTESELSLFVKNIQEIGNRTATTTSQLLEATAVFARSGYTKEQISLLTEEAAVLKNVSDGITDMSKAAETLISVMKAYHVEAEEARNITDTLNAISNKSAISFDDLAEGLSRVGSVFASQDTSIAQLSAMLTGANEILQNIEKTSTGLKTISQRLRGISDDTNEEGVNLAKLQGIVADITSKYGKAVRITDEHTGQLRGTYDIVSDLAEVWTSMSKNEQQLLGEKIAGKTQITVLQALLNNWDSVKNAIGNAELAAGSAAREQEAYINSLTGALNQFKATLENIYASVMDSTWAAGIVRAADALLKVFDKIIGIGPLLSGLLTGGAVGKLQQMALMFGNMTKMFGNVGFSGFKNFLELTWKNLPRLEKGASKILDDITEAGTVAAQLTSDQRKQVNQVLELTKGYKNVNIGMVQQLAYQTQGVQLSAEELKYAGQTLAVQQASIALRSLGISLAITGIAMLARYISQAAEKARAAVVDSFSEYESKVENLKNKIKEITDTIEADGGKTTTEQLEKLAEFNEELRVTEILAERAKKKVIELAAGSAKIYGKQYATAFGRTAEVGGSERRAVTNEKLGWDFDIGLKDFEQFYDAQGKLLKEKYVEAYDFVRSNAVEASKELAEVTGDEWWAQVDAEFDKLAALVDEETARLNKVVTLGITKTSLTEFLVERFKGIEWSEIIDQIDDSIGQEFYSKIFPEGNITNTNIEKFYARLDEINGENIRKWQQTYTEVMAVDRALGDYVNLYSQAVYGTSDILNILENWEKYADVLEVDVNGNLKISKDLVIARAKAELATIKSSLEAKAVDIEQEIAREKVQLEVAKNALENAKLEIGAINRKVEANLKLNTVLQNQKAIAKGLEPTETIQGVGKWQTRVDDLTTSIANQESYLKNLRAQIEAIEKMDVEAILKKASAGTKTAKDATRELNNELNNLKNILSALKQEMTDTTDLYKKVQSAMKDIVQAEIDALEDENDLLDESMKYYDARIKLIEEYYESGIDELKKQQEAAVAANEAEQDAIEDKIDALKEATDEYEKQNKAAQDAIDEQVKALEAQIDAIDEANDAREKELEMQERLLNIEKARLAMEKAKDAYEAAKASKTVRTYDAERGWIYTADQAAVQSAYGEYQSAVQNYQKLLDELAKAQAEAERQAQKDAIQAQIDELKDQKEILKEQLEQTKEDADAQEEAWKKELDLLKDQKDEIKESFEQQIDELENQSDILSNIEDDVDRMLDKYLNDEDVLAWVEAYKNASEEERAAMEAELRDRWAEDKGSQLTNKEQIDSLKSLIKDIEGMLDTTDSILNSEGIKAWLESFKAGGFDEREDMIGEMRRAYLEFYESQQAEIDKVTEAINQLEGTLVTTNDILKQNWGTGKEHTPVNSYANGGVVNSGLLMNTGMLSNRVKVHGTPSSPEVILNGRQQANLLYRLAQQQPSVVNNSSPSNTTSMYVATLNIQADSQDTLYGLLLQAKQLAAIS